MSKLAHSHQPTMDAIDRQRAIENGDEDLLPVTCPRCKQVMADRDCAEGCEDHDCPFIGGEK